jgi:hypothetical protein
MLYRSPRSLQDSSPAGATADNSSSNVYWYLFTIAEITFTATDTQIPTIIRRLNDEPLDAFDAV